MSVGSELRRAREREGLSSEQIAERTKVPLYKIEALENGNFENLPSDIYLDGIIRAYAREVNSDPEPLIQRVHHERRTVVDDWDVDVGGLSGLLKEQPPESEQPPPASVPEKLFSTQRDRFGAPGGRRIALPLVALLAIAGWSAYFYEVMHRGERQAPIASTSNATARPDDDPAPAPVEPVQPDQTPGPEPSQASTNPRTPSTSSTRASTSAPAPGRDAAATAGTTAPAGPPRVTAPPAAAPVPPTPVAPAPPIPAATASNAPATPQTQNVAGVWSFTTNVESSNVQQFSGMRLGYEIQLTQTGDHISGTGRKVAENGKPIGSQAQTPISLAGTIKGDRLTLTFTEKGTQRDSQGKFVLLADEGTLRGRFSSTAAQSSGTVEAHRAAGAR